MRKLSDIYFYFITYPSLSKNDIFSDAYNAISAGCSIVQYREKNKSTREMIKEAKKLKELCEGRAVFIVDDRADVAFAVDADGVHLGKNDIPVDIARRILGKDKIIGLTVRNVDDALEAERLGVDYISLGPIFETSTKEDTIAPCGIEMIKKVKEVVNVPIVAIGGINRNNIREVIKAGADGVAAVSAVLRADDVFLEVREFITIIEEEKLSEQNRKSQR